MKRLLFATPFVVTACSSPSRTEPVEPTPPPSVDAAIAPDADERPSALVRELEPLRYKSVVEMCKRARCNPPPPNVPQPPGRTDPYVREVRAMRRETTGTRVRIARGDTSDTRFDRRTRIVFLNNRADELPAGECKLVDWDIDEIECTTKLAPEQLAENRVAFRVRVEPPATPEEPPATPEDHLPETPKTNVAPITARVIKHDVIDTRVLVVIEVGRKRGVDKQWTARVVREDGQPIAGGSCTIVRIDDTRTLCTVRLTADQVAANPRVRIDPPPVTPPD